MFLRVIFIAASTVFAARALAGSAATAAPAPGDLRRDDGVVTVQTITTAGHDFSQYFLAAWRDYDGSQYHTLALRERPSARFGSELWIAHAERTVLHLRLPPARAGLASLASGAAQQVWTAVQRAEAERVLLRARPRDTDLAPDEF